MEFIYEKIFVPHKHSFITRKLKMDPNSDKIHSHKNFELNLITSGAGRRIVGNHISSYQKGDLVLLGPNISHCWEILETEINTEPECIVTHFYENIISSDFFNIPELEPVVNLLKDAKNGIWFKGPKAEKVAATLHKMVNLSGLELYIQLLKVFDLLLKIENREYLALPSSLPSSYKKDGDQINTIYEYVFQNIQEGVKLKEAASLVFMEPSSFCRYFKKKTNKTFMEYVKSVRIGIAAKLLAETDKQVTQICYECGYNNLANFNHYFKITMNKTPSEYRKSFK
ncbi:MAG: helix-turn-helix transcriptional regulator [Prolixibacteraceae bacterium]|jgi:AraC-like DNA-binding protein|nr:helix-turn-helix transcriptional regulator [Prolixibacteraceae bacterium]MBT6005271.1 helix-turn-helix transcriptional regulator [Prolixibacteraceae bacterium]MBT6766025.1 helix-turn-helix transcriptional regulator [Prolixibacteraceae bacterium]MBT6997672.1 helix-turn-helix transcriptional regulator [Prolixibacteraceae bacterium]MBT7396110.1 helix-turn-helix transcriptional regulator [Prolixibacteraceae bacterium]